MTLRNNGYSLAVASRIEDIPGAYQLQQLFGIMQYFQYKEIYPVTKTVHLTSYMQRQGWNLSV
jgi:predicted phosphatase